jgi:hypothetical protein
MAESTAAAEGAAGRVAIGTVQGVEPASTLFLISGSTAAGQGVRARLICAQAHIRSAQIALLTLFIDPQSGDR